MALVKAEWAIDPKLFEEAGVNIHDPHLKERKEARDRKLQNMRIRNLKRNHSRVVWKKSLWASGEIEFTFADWKPDERDNPQQAKDLGNKAYKLAKEMEHGHLNVIMSGDAGVGKTSLALAMLNKLRDSGKQVLFVSTVALSKLVGEHYDYTDKAKRLEDLTRAMSECDVLLLDDFGAEGGSPDKVMSAGYTGTRKDVQRIMFDIANNRYEGTAKERKKADDDGVKLIKPVHGTIITTNNVSEELKRIYGERTFSRLVTQNPDHRLAFNDMEDMRPKEGI